MSEWPPCPTCGAVADEFRIPVWSDPTDAEADNDPDYIGCTECQTMTRYEEVTNDGA